MNRKAFQFGVVAFFILVFGFVLSGNRTFALPGEFGYLGPVTWKSNVDKSSYVIREDYTRQIVNDVVIQGQISASKKISKETVLINFASQESGLQIVLVPSNKSEKMKLRLIVRSDVPINNECYDCIKPRHVVSIGDVLPNGGSNTFLIRIRNNPGEYLVEFNGKERRQPKDFSPSEVNLDMSYIKVGDNEIAAANEEVSIEKLTIGISSDVRQLKFSYIIFSFLLVLLVWSVSVYARPKSKDI